jgi:hypothetical protein
MTLSAATYARLLFLDFAARTAKHVARSEPCFNNAKSRVRLRWKSPEVRGKSPILRNRLHTRIRSPA